MLNRDQHRTLSLVQDWWGDTKSPYFIIDGKGGVGKTFLVDEILRQLPRCIPVILTPTNEALKQVKEKVTGDYLYRTVCSALGISPTTHEEDISFEQLTLPSFWDEVNLVVLDESSMVDEVYLHLLISIGIKILFLGHKSQLPPVKLKRPIFDKCISPVFEQGFPVSTLTLPMRNTGALWDYNNILEEKIYDNSRTIPDDFTIKSSEFLGYINSDSGKDAIHKGETKLIGWTNPGIDRTNSVIRNIIFGDASLHSKYLPSDKIILIKPLCTLEELEKFSDLQLKRLVSSKDQLTSFFSNAKAEVISCKVVTINLNKALSFPCYKVAVICEGIETSFYEPVNKEDLAAVSEYYKHIAWNKHNPTDKKKAFKEMHFILSFFASIKHYYAATTYRLQGASVDSVIVLAKDINRCPNIIEKAKHHYVAASRVVNNLMVYKGDV